jgi:DNA gyrase subunit A
VELPAADGRRDGSGVPAAQPIAAIGSPVTAQVTGDVAAAADGAPTDAVEG